jgi:predicted ATPase/DNA-binding SARP family transcriptional activator
VYEPAAITASCCRLHLLGAFRIQCDGHPVPLRRRKVESLFAYLALHQEEHAREKLAALFWAEFPDAQARHSLSNAITVLRRQIGDRLLLADRETVQMNPAFSLWVDAVEFQGRVKSGGQGANWAAEAQAGIDLYQDDLLPDFYDEWIAPVRERLRSLYHETLLRLIELARMQGEYGHAIELAKRMLTGDSASEPAHQHLMFCYAMTGNRAAALQQYKECERILREELAAEPAAETRALHEWIKQASTERSRAEGRITNLPTPLTSFVGREQEIAHLKALLSNTRLLTVTGAGGSGKTRLAIQVAKELIQNFQEGVWWVDLAPLIDPSHVPQAMAQVLGVRESPYTTLSETLLNFLRPKELLLVLDNCEHLVTRCAELAAEILSNCPKVQIMATSREALRIDGETVWQVPTLSLPPLRLPPGDALTVYEAIRLFVERAVAVNGKFSLNAENAPAVAEICRRLDGIPLAIELAAARIKVLAPERIAARLDNRFDLLTVGSRVALPRHQTLRLTFDWSHELLTEAERVLFRRLSVFVGGFNLEAAEEVCADEKIEAPRVLELVSHLVDKSLITAEPQQGERRFRLLETGREYAREKLGESGEAGRLRKRHFNFFLRLAEEAEPKLTSAERLSWLERLESEHDNLRAALEWSQDQAGRREAMLRLAGSLYWFWHFGGHVAEGRRGLERVLARSPGNLLEGASRAKCRNRA